MKKATCYAQTIPPSIACEVIPSLQMVVDTMVTKLTTGEEISSTEIKEEWSTPSRKKKKTPSQRAKAKGMREREAKSSFQDFLNMD